MRGSIVPFLLSGSSLLTAANERFWDTQNPNAWTAGQIHELTTKSPWAKSVVAELKSNSSNMAADAARSRDSARGGVRSNRETEADPAIVMPKFQTVVRWVSAKPMMLALKYKLPAALRGRYVISVEGLPITRGETDADHADPFAALKEATTLQLKRSESAQPEVAYQDSADTSSIYFGFLPSMLKVEEAKIAAFTMISGPFAVRAKFNLEEMKYRGELSV